MKSFKVGLDSYCLKPLRLSPFEVLEWAVLHGAEGVQFSEGARFEDPEREKVVLDDLAEFAAQNSLYIEWGGGQHIPIDIKAGAPLDISAVNRRAAAQASRLGVRTVRSCSGGLMRWTAGGIPTDRFLRETAHALRADLPMLRDHGVVLALETHFEFTTFEILRIFEMCGVQPGDALGVCLDTMNLLTMLEDPAAAVRRIAPWIVTTHIKDGGLLLGESGLVSFSSEIGKGVVDIPAVLAVLAGLDREVTLSIEDHGGDFVLPIFDPEFRKEFPDLTVGELSDLLRLVRRTGVLAEREGLAPLDRSRWPLQCEVRVRRDIAALKAFAGGGS